MKILTVKLGHLGDTLLLTPTLRFLAQKFPGARVDAMVRSGCEVMLRGNPDVTHVLPVGSPERSQRTPGRELRESAQAFRTVACGARYDYTFDLSLSDRAKWWTLLSRARVRVANRHTLRGSRWGRIFTGLSDFDWGPHHQVLHDFRTVADFIEPGAQPGPLRFYPQVDEPALKSKLPWVAGLKDFVVIHPTSRWPFKQWLPERWAVVADALARRGMQVVLSCGPSSRETDYINAILAAAQVGHLATRGQTSLHELGWLLGRARLFLGVDTVGMHLAAAMQTPSVALFGPSSEWSWHPWQCRHELVLGACPCKAKRWFTCDKNRPYPCMEAITAEQAFQAAANVLEARPVP